MDLHEFVYLKRGETVLKAAGKRPETSTLITKFFRENGCEALRAIPERKE